MLIRLTIDVPDGIPVARLCWAIKESGNRAAGQLGYGILKLEDMHQNIHLIYNDDGHPDVESFICCYPD